MSEPITAAHMPSEAIIGALPASARALVEVIGLDATLELLRKFGGKRLFVPHTVRDESKLVRLLGREVTQKLSDAMPGERLEPASLFSVEMLLRNAAIRADFHAGSRYDELADRYGLTLRHLRKVLMASRKGEAPTGCTERPEGAFPALGATLAAAWSGGSVAA